MDSKEFANAVLKKITAQLNHSSIINENNLCIVVTGSYGREEASKESDMDWFAIETTGSGISDSVINTVREIVNSSVRKNTGSTGTFDAQISKSKLLQNYGGNLETNQDFTRRMLYLLESKCLFNDKEYKKLKKEIVETYIKRDIPDNGVNRFMLNDIIRYYRTMCTDYEYKVSEDGKSWGLRKIKLRFSRKLLYFSGLLTVADTCSYSREMKIEKTLDLLALPPMARIEEIITPEKSTKISNLYDKFQTMISDNNIRQQLDSVKREERHKNEHYRELKNLSQHFSWELEKVLASTFPTSHPIHSSLIF